MPPPPAQLGPSPGGGGIFESVDPRSEGRPGPSSKTELSETELSEAELGASPRENPRLSAWESPSTERVS